jgi:hypothetical protein
VERRKEGGLGSRVLVMRWITLSSADCSCRVGPTLTSLLGTLKRTKRLEGWYGLYKGQSSPSWPIQLELTLQAPTLCLRSPP